MNWDMLSAIGEILGSIAVFVTLIYLTIQTRQSTAAIRANTRQEMLAADQQYIMSFVHDPKLETIRYKPGLTDDEKVRLGFLLITFIRMRENNWLQYQNGVLDEQTWNTYRNAIRALMGNPRARTWWQNYAVGLGMFDSRFTTEVSELIAGVPMRDRSAVIAAFD